MISNPSKLFAEAVRAFKKGDLPNALNTCLTLTQNAAPNAICLHLIGVIKHQQGYSDEAEQWLRQSLALNPEAVEVNFNLGLSLLAQNKMNEALLFFEKTTDINPTYANAYFQIGNIHKTANQFNKAISSYEKCLLLNPNHHEALNCLGVVLCRQNKQDQAISCFTKALVIHPQFPEALNNMGVAYLELDRPDQTKEFCEKAIALRPDYTAALNNLGTALKEEGSYNDAIKYYERALSLDPNLLEARNNLGLSIMFGRSSIESALTCFREVLKRSPNHPEALNNLGITLCHQGQFDEGITCYRRALDIKHDYTDALSNLACALRATGNATEALSLFEQVVRQKPNFAEAHNNYAMMLMSLGQFVKGFREYEWRWKTSQLKEAYRDFGRPCWRGEDLTNKTLFIYAEQGFGDTLQFCRFVSFIKKNNTNIILEVPEPLVRLVKSLKGVDAIIPYGESPPAFDFQCPMLDLPLVFNIDVQSIPADTPYLYAEPDDIAHWKKRLTSRLNIKKVGLVWSGNPRKHSFELAAIDRQRSLPIHFLEPLFQSSGIEFYSLQKDATSIPATYPLINFMDDCSDFADTAALISQLDLVISVDTAAVHLAGALGKPVWLLNRYDSCWRWLSGRDDSPWYPKLYQFRQTQYNDWKSVIERVVQQLSVIDC